MSDDYRVQLDVFSGPLDLLLYLIRRDELDIQDIPIAHIAEQYLQYVGLLESVDPNSAGDFLVMASTLVELKSRALLPTPPLETEDDADDPRQMLVRQLLEYKRFKDAAQALGTSADDRARRFVRKPVDLPRDLDGVELEEAQVWDLLDAFGRVMSSIGQGPGLHEVTYDDTPISEHKDFILDRLERRGPIQFGSLFDRESTRAEVVGMFLAVLELIRNRQLRAEQDALHGTIYLFALVEVEEEYDDEAEAEAETTAEQIVPDEEATAAVAAAVAPTVDLTDEPPTEDYPEQSEPTDTEPEDEHAEPTSE